MDEGARKKGNFPHFPRYNCSHVQRSALLKKHLAIPKSEMVDLI